MLNDGARYFDKAERDRQHAPRRIQRPEHSFCHELDYWTVARPGFQVVATNARNAPLPIALISFRPCYTAEKHTFMDAH